MSSRNYSDFSKCVYNYLGYYDYRPDDKTDSIIEECYKEVCKLAQFKYKYAEFDFLPEVLQNPIYENFLSGCKKYIIGVMTLGPAVDSKIKHYSKRDLVKMCIFDSVASAYLEFKSDEFEEQFGEDRTYRFCPGYQGTDFRDISELFKLVKPEKALGVTILESGLMVPLKTMCGIVGVGTKKKKNCGDCLLAGNCNYVKEGRRCYN